MLQPGMPFKACTAAGHAHITSMHVRTVGVAASSAVIPCLTKLATAFGHRHSLNATATLASRRFGLTLRGLHFIRGRIRLALGGRGT